MPRCRRKAQQHLHDDKLPGPALRMRATGQDEILNRTREGCARPFGVAFVTNLLRKSVAAFAHSIAVAGRLPIRIAMPRVHLRLI
jgi:hypothetical protein